MTASEVLGAEPKLPDSEELVFASSAAKLLLPSEMDVNPYAKALAGILLLGAVLGFINGLDWVTADRGLVQPHEFIYSQTFSAPPGSAILLGMVEAADGGPAVNYSIHVRSEKSGNHATLTDGNGQFRIENLTPDLVLLDIALIEENLTLGVSHRVLLSPPGGFEGKGYTNLRLVFPPDADFNITGESPAVHWIDFTPDEMAVPLYDPSAAVTYVMVGYGFLSLSLIAAVLAGFAVNNGNLGMVRTAAVLIFFSMGHFYSACCIGLAVGVSSFMVEQHR